MIGRVKGLEEQKSDGSWNYWLAWSVFGLQRNSNLGCIKNQCINPIPTDLPPAENKSLQCQLPYEKLQSTSDSLNKDYMVAPLIFVLLLSKCNCRWRSEPKMWCWRAQLPEGCSPVVWQGQPWLCPSWELRLFVRRTVSSSAWPGCSNLRTSSKHKCWSYIGLPGHWVRFVLLWSAWIYWSYSRTSVTTVYPAELNVRF